VSVSLADESALLTELRGLLARGQARDAAQRLAELAGTPQATRAPFALLAAEAAGRLGLYAEAERAALTALAVAQDTGEATTAARAWNIRGAVALERGDTALAEECFSACLAAARAETDATIAARALNNLGILANLRGAHTEALTNYQLALAAYQQAGDARGVAQTHHNIGITRRDLADLAGGLESAEHAVRLANQSGDSALWAQALLGRAEMHLATGDAALAAAQIARARTTYANLDHPVGLAEALRLEAAVAAHQGDPSRGETLLREAAALAERQGSAHTLAEILRDLGATAARRGDAATAAAARARAIALFRQLGAVHAAERLESSGVV